jgi:hypothetical protein
VLLETQSDTTTNSIESVGVERKQELNIDSTKEVLYWQKANKDNLFAEAIQEATGLLGHAISVYSRDMAKQLNKLKKF